MLKKLVPFFIIILSCYLNSCTIEDDEKLGGLADDDSILAFYPLNGNGKDTSGNGHDGTVYGATADNDRFGNSGRATYFNSVESDSIQIPAENGFNLSNTPFSISLWIYNDDLSTNTAFIFYDSSAACFICLFADSGYFTLKIGLNSYNFFTPQVLTWYHIAITYNGDALSFYVNGTEEFSLTSLYFTEFTGNGMLEIGVYNSGSLYFNGRIDEFAVFKRWLSSDEVDILYQNSM